jgi:hypothetical protein
MTGIVGVLASALFLLITCAPLLLLLLYTAKSKSRPMNFERFAWGELGGEGNKGRPSSR